MPVYSWDQVSEIFDLDLAKQSDAKDRRKYKKFRLEVTLSLPPTAEFQRRTLQWRMRKLRQMFRDLCLHWEFRDDCEILTTQSYVELGKKNNREHLHGYIDLYPERAYSSQGAVHESVWTLLRHYRRWKTHGTFKEECYYDDFTRYVDQNVCCQYISFDQKERIEEWDKYIRKNA